MLRPWPTSPRGSPPCSSRTAASVALAAPAGAADAAVIPFTPDRWTLSEGIKVVEHRGVQAIEIPRLPTRPEAVLKGLTFTNGTIEVDVEGTTGLGPSIGFHRRDSATYELFYVRPQPDCATRPDCVQYAPVDEGRAAVGHLSRAAGAGALPARPVESREAGGLRPPPARVGQRRRAGTRRHPARRRRSRRRHRAARAPASWPT